MHKVHVVLDNDLKIRSMGPAGASVGKKSPAAIYAKVGHDAAGIVAKALGAPGEPSPALRRAPVIRRPSTGSSR
jgi:hypothetical protein